MTFHTLYSITTCVFSPAADSKPAELLTDLTKIHTSQQRSNLTYILLFFCLDNSINFLFSLVKTIFVDFVPTVDYIIFEELTFMNIGTQTIFLQTTKYTSEIVQIFLIIISCDYHIIQHALHSRNTLQYFIHGSF